MVRVGLVGAGNISETHARAAAAIPGVSVVAVWSRTREHAARLAAQHSAAAYTELDEFLDHRPMDLVAIGSPSGLHAEHGIAAARRGLHVLVEKPIDVSTTRADALIAAAGHAGVKLGVFFQDRLKPDVRRLKALVDAGHLGAPILASARVKWYRPPEYYAEWGWRGTLALDGGGALMNQGIHSVDLLLWLFGPVSRVAGATATRIHAIEAEDTAVAVLEFDSGALGTLEATTAAYPGYARRIELTGSNGTVVLEGDRLAAIDLREQAPGLETLALTPAPQGADPRAVSPRIVDASAHRAVFEDFIRAVRTGARPSCDGADARRAVELIEAIYTRTLSSSGGDTHGTTVQNPY